jgi:hypothetical protein
MAHGHRELDDQNDLRQVARSEEKHRRKAHAERASLVPGHSRMAGLGSRNWGGPARWKGDVARCRARLATSISPLWPLFFLVILIGVSAAVWHCSCFRFRGVPLGPPNGYAGCQMPGPRPNRKCEEGP